MVFQCLPSLPLDFGNFASEVGEADPPEQPLAKGAHGATRHKTLAHALLTVYIRAAPCG